MDNPNLQVLQTLLQLGWPAIVLVEVVILYRDNIKLRDWILQNLTDREADNEGKNEPKAGSGMD